LGEEGEAFLVGGFHGGALLVGASGETTLAFDLRFGDPLPAKECNGEAIVGNTRLSLPLMSDRKGVKPFG
jgi:hypothetical protein